MKLLELYEKSLEKWENIRKDIPRSLHHYSLKCAFCYDVEKPTLYTVQGDYCGSRCLIDKKICGSPKSLMVKLSDVYHMMIRRNKEFSKCWKMVRKVRRALRKKVKEQLRVRGVKIDAKAKSFRGQGSNL